MTTIYFIRHAQPDFGVKDDMLRPLSPKGKQDCLLVTSYLETKQIDVVLSSPYQRARDTVAGFAQKNQLELQLVDVFRERNIGMWVDDFMSFAKRQWAEFTYKLPGGESLEEVQKRNVDALNDVLEAYEGKKIVIGTHGTALSTIIQHYDTTYGYDDFLAIINVMPWVVVMEFDGKHCSSIEKIDLIALHQIEVKA